MTNGEDQPQIEIEVLLFAAAAEALGSRQLRLSLPSNATVETMCAQLSRQHPNLAHLIAVSRWAIESEFVAAETQLSSDRPIAMIPPVSGG